jgi:TonB family protein
MVLQKAKQRALEEAGTYVESYTHLRNLDLTIDEIKTIAGGVMRTEIVEQNRALEGSGTRFYIKIRALVTTDKIEDLARRKQLGPLAAENKRLQDDIAKLNRDLEDFKRQILQSKTESEREVVLEKIREVEKQFRQVRSTETALYRRLLSGEELSAQVDKAFREEQRRRGVAEKQSERQRDSLERVLTTLRSNGHTITIGLPEPDVSLDQPDTVVLRFRVTAEASKEARSAIHDLHVAYGGDLPDDAARQIDEVLARLRLVLTVFLQDGHEYVSKEQPIHNYKSALLYDLNQIVKDKPAIADIKVPIPRNVVNKVASVEGKIEVQTGPVAQPQQAVKVPVAKTPETALKISGKGGSNPYWARVQSIISSQWEPPPIDMAGQTYTVIVKFRLQRDGTIKDVVVQQSSGNTDFDMAGQRAVQRPRVLPVFPADMTDSYKDVEMVFRVGELAG